MTTKAGLRQTAAPAAGQFLSACVSVTALAIATAVLVASQSGFAAAADAAAGSTWSEPLWRQGISTWNGDRYEIPDRRDPAPAPRAPSVYRTVPGPDRSGRSAAAPPPTAARSPQSPATAPPTQPPGAQAAPLPSAAPSLGPQPEAHPSPDGSSLPIGEQLESGAPAEQPPLQEDVSTWYQYPWLWKGWNNHAEFGLDGSSGNSNTLAIQTGLEMKRKTDAYTLGIDLDYRQASNREGTTEDNGQFNFDFDRLLGESRWSMFHKFGMEWDRFKAFDLRLNANSGFGYHWIRTERSSLVTRLGAGVSKEFGSPDDPWVPEAVFGIEAEHQLTERQKLLGKIEYFPAWENFSDFRLVTDVGWEILLDDSENLSLKLALTDRYDSTPQGAKPNDLYYSLLLLYKF